MALISLDVFDTAIFRKVFKPTDIFHIVEDEVGGNFHNLRIEAQNKARKVSAYYNIFDIYSYIPQFNPKEEIKAEYANCKANPYILDMYNNSKDEFIFISDMYLPEKVIVGMLERCGYKNPRVFVSCDCKAVKSNGGLFKVVEGKIGRKISKHIGDNYTGDIEGSKKAKIPNQEFVGLAVYNKEVITPELKDVRLRKLLIDEELSNASVAEKIGYWFAPLIYSFTKKVLDEAKDNQTIFFNARDCFLMYVVARWILKTKKKIKYCRFSRKSCLIADIETNKPITDDANRVSLHFLRISRANSIRDLLRMLRINTTEECTQVLRKYNITMDSNIEFHELRTVIVREALKYYQKQLYAISSVDRSNFLKYISRLNMKNGDIFVDLGYKGTIQRSIKRISQINLKGKYLNTFDNKSFFWGVLVEKESFLPVGFLCAYTGASLEVIFSEAKGTAMAYDNTGKPILLKDYKVRKDITKAILRGALKGVKAIHEENIKVSMEDGLAIIKRYLDKPTIDEAEFMNQPIFENGSCDSFESITWYDKDFIRQGKLKECYSRSYWKNAFKVLLENDPELKFLRKEIGR